MQHLPILKICSCPCQAGPKTPGGFLVVELRAVRAEEIIASLSTPLFSMILSHADEEEDSKTLYLVVPVRLKD